MLTKEFFAVAKPEDIDPVQLSEYLTGIYGAKTDETLLYDSNFAEYKRQAEQIVDLISTLCTENKFPNDAAKLAQLKKHFMAACSAGETSAVVELIKISAETIYYQLEQLKAADPANFKLPQIFKNEITNATLNACAAGAASNMQAILFSINPNYYNLKYEFIRGLAADFIRTNGMQTDLMDVLTANELIYAVRNLYALAPPTDVYAQYT